LTTLPSHASSAPTAPVGARATSGRRDCLLGLDVGDRRVGVALADPATGSIRPLATIQRRSTARDAVVLGRLADEHGVAELVVGLPLMPAGTEGEQARGTRDWADAIGALLRLPVAYRDERLTSRAAEARLGRPRRGASGGAPSVSANRAYRARIDREAAAAILQAELDARSTGGRA
jgi:putative Holliday junction resolvase